MRISRRLLLILSLVGAVIFAGFYRQYAADFGELFAIMGLTLSIAGGLFALSKADEKMKEPTPPLPPDKNSDA